MMKINTVLYLLFLFFIPFSTASAQFDFGTSSQGNKLKTTDITPQEKYLMRFKAICNDIKPEDDWDAYLETFDEDHPITSGLKNKAGTYGRPTKAKAINLLMVNKIVGDVDMSTIAPHFPVQYLYRYYPTEFLKTSPNNRKLAYANEFDLRKFIPEGKKRLVKDAAALPFGEERYLRGMPLKRSTYDFDNQCFYVSPDFSSAVGFQGMYNGSEAFHIPLTIIEEYKSFFEKIKIPIPETEAEQLFQMLDASNNVRLWPKIVFTILDEPVDKPVYYCYNGYNWSVLYPLKFEIKYIDFEVFIGFNEEPRQLVYRLKDIPKPSWDSWAINGGQINTQGTPGPVSEKLGVLTKREEQSKATTANANKPNASAQSPQNKNKVANAGKKDYKFIRLYKGRPKEKYAHYAGVVKNKAGSIKQFEQMQLELCYSYYTHSESHFLRALMPSQIYGGIYLGVKGEEGYLGQALNKVDMIYDRGYGYKFDLGRKPYGKYMRQAGFKNAYCEALFNKDDSINFTLYDSDGKVQFTAHLRPLDRNEKPPFTNN